MGILELGTTPEVRKALYAVANKIKIDEIKSLSISNLKLPLKLSFEITQKMDI